MSLKLNAIAKKKPKKIPAEHEKKYGILRFQEFFPSSFE